MAETIHINIINKQYYIKIVVSGKLNDGASCLTLKEKIEDVIIDRPEHIVIDLIGVDHLYSTSLSVFVSAQKKCKDLSIRISFLNVSPHAKKILEIMSLINYFKIYDNESEIEI